MGTLKINSFVIEIPILLGPMGPVIKEEFHKIPFAPARIP